MGTITDNRTSRQNSASLSKEKTMLSVDTDYFRQSYLFRSGGGKRENPNSRNIKRRNTSHGLRTSKNNPNYDPNVRSVATSPSALNSINTPWREKTFFDPNEERAKTAGILETYQGERTPKLVRHGVGLYKYSNKFFTYEGEWYNGKKHGRGKLTMTDGTYYEGNFVDGEINGRGLKVWSDGKQRYRGQFTNGQLDGEGKLVYSNGDVYEGSFSRNMRAGYGTLTDATGLYRGMFADNQRNGDGMQQYGNTALYVGKWQNDKPHGFGRFSNNEGFELETEFVEGSPVKWPSRIEICETPTVLNQGHYLEVNFRYLDQHGQAMTDWKGFKSTLTAWYKKPSLPKLKKAWEYPKPPELDQQFETIKTPFFRQATRFPITAFEYYVMSLWYPYHLIEDEFYPFEDGVLREAFNHVLALRQIVANELQPSVQDEEQLEKKLKADGIKLTEESEHPSAHWPFPAVDDSFADCAGCGRFEKVAFPQAKENYGPFLIEEYNKEIEKLKKKANLAHYFGDRPDDIQYDALGRPIVAGEEEEVEQSKYPGLSLEDLSKSVENQLTKLLSRNYSKKGDYVIRVEDTTSEGVYSWFGLQRPEPGYLKVKIQRQKNKQKKRKKESRSPSESSVTSANPRKNNDS